MARTGEHLAGCVFPRPGGKSSYEVATSSLAKAGVNRYDVGAAASGVAETSAHAATAETVGEFQIRSATEPCQFEASDARPSF